MECGKRLNYAFFKKRIATMNEGNSFSNIKITGWRQFRNIDIDFHDRLTIITVANGAGKSSILSIPSQHFGWSRNFLSTPKRDDGALGPVST
ncbi:AAA family ATPase [Komagataeibacter europaeus]|uniref:AAA family ATPase n=1 Tax=Komagataeibacter europaeus TaxID=33995 RepID=UPI0035712BE7